MTLEENFSLHPQVNLTKQLDFTPSHTLLQKKKKKASDDLHEVTLGNLLITHWKESINTDNWKMSVMVYIILSYEECVLLL